MKRFLFALMAMTAILFAFSSCGKEDDPEDNTPPPPVPGYYVTEIVVNTYSTRRPDNNQDWDQDGSGPDLQWFFGPVATPEKYRTDTFMDVVPSAHLPVRFPRGAAKYDREYLINNEVLRFTLKNNNQGSRPDDLMYTFDANIVENGTHPYTKHEGQWRVEVHWQWKD